MRAEYRETDFVAVGFGATPAGTAGFGNAVVEGAGEPHPWLPITSPRVGAVQPTPGGVLL